MDTGTIRLFVTLAETSPASYETCLPTAGTAARPQRPFAPLHMCAYLHFYGFPKTIRLKYYSVFIDSFTTRFINCLLVFCFILPPILFLVNLLIPLMFTTLFTSFVTYLFTHVMAHLR